MFGFHTPTKTKRTKKIRTKAAAKPKAKTAAKPKAKKTTATSKRKPPKGGMSPAQIKSKGSAIMAEAKRIRKASPSKDWRTCVGEAAKKLKK